MSTDNPALKPEELLANAAWLQRLAMRLVDPSTAEDVVQDTWATALRRPPRIDGEVRPWLATVLRNLVRNRVRAGRRWQDRAQRIAAADDAPLPTAEDLLAYHQAQRLVVELVTGLEEPYRSTVLLCYGQGVSPSEVAERQGIPAGTVRWRLKRGLDDLRARLDARHGGDRGAWALVLAPLASARSLVPVAAPVWALWQVAAAVAVLAGFGAWLGMRQPAQPVSRGAAAESPSPRPPRFAGPPPGRAPQANVLAAAAVPSGAEGAPSPRAEAIRRAMDAGSAPTRGPADAPVTIVMFAEFQCPFCARAQATLKELQAAYPREVRVVWRDLPLPFHEHAALAAEAARAAGEQGKFWEMHDRLFAHQDALDPPALTEHARALGLDVGKFQKALDSQSYRKTVEDDVRLAKEAGANGTPIFLVNGKEVSGARPLAEFKRMVDEALGRAPADAPRPPPGGPLPPEAQLWRGRPPVISPAGIERAAKAGNPAARGEPNAPVTVVMFGDFQCPYTAKAQPVLAQLLAAHPKEVRLVWRNLPLPFHANAALAAEAALAANEQGKFWPMHDRLLANQNALDRASLDGHAAAVGLDLPRFKAALDERRFRRAVEEDVRLSQEAGFRGTPAFLIGDAPLEGAQQFDRFENGFQRALAKAKGLPVPPELPPGGTARRFDPFAGAWPPPRLALPDELLGEPARVPFAIGDAPTLGPARAPVEVLYLVDLGCPFCGGGKGVVDGLHRSYGEAVRIVAIPVPQDAEGQMGTTFAEAAWAAQAQGKFWALHDEVLANPRPGQTREGLEQQSRALGVDTDAVKEALDSRRYRARVLEDVEKMKEAKLRPGTFIVNGRRAAGTIALVALVDRALEKAGRRPPALPAPAAPLDARTLDRYQVTIPQRFLLEPRNDDWASALEKQLAPMMERDLKTLDPTASGLRLECKAQVCRARWTAGRLGAAVTRGFLRELYVGEIAARSAPPTPELYLWARPTSPMGAQEDLVARSKSRRSGVLYSLRTGRTKVDGLSADRVPKE